MTPEYLFTSESVSQGHPDKAADQIADAILDEALRQDIDSRVACEVLLTRGLIFLAGEVTTKASLDYESIARDTLAKIGYTSSEVGFDAYGCGFLHVIQKQSPEIAKGVGKDRTHLGAGDQGMMFGYACDETESFMPLPITLAHDVMLKIVSARQNRTFSMLRPDAKVQVTVEYLPDGTPHLIHTVVLSTQHDPSVDLADLRRDVEAFLRQILPKSLLSDRTRFIINPMGRFVLGGPCVDCGLTGRKTVVDTYGGMARLGGGSLSGKDPTKVDRSGAYAARYVAKNIVAAGLARRCEVQIAYAIGREKPVACHVETFGTSHFSSQDLVQAVFKTFDFSPSGIAKAFDLFRPLYEKTAFGGHFGRSEFPWERCDLAADLKNFLHKKS